MLVSPSRWWAHRRQGLSLALPPVLSQTAWDPWKWFCNLHACSSPYRGISDRGVRALWSRIWRRSRACSEMRGLWGAAAGHLHSQSFLLSPGRKCDSCQASKWRAWEDHRTCAGEKWAPPQKKNNWGKLLTVGDTERELSDTAGQCPPPWRAWVYVSL